MAPKPVLHPLDFLRGSGWQGLKLGVRKKELLCVVYMS